VVFDEAHNIDNVCIEVMSITLNRDILNAATENATQLNKEVKKAERSSSKRLQDEYARLVHGLASSAGMGAAGDGDVLASPLLPANILREAVPGNIRLARNFVDMLGAFVYELKQKLNLASAQV